MQVQAFSNGGFVAHEYRIPGLKSKFSVWYDRYGFPIDASRIDAKGRAFDVPRKGKAWAYIERYIPAALVHDTSRQALQQACI